MATGEQITLSDLAAVSGWVCHLCLDPIDRTLRGRHPMMPSFDHLIPISRGGIDASDNLALAHLSCNVRRGNRILTDQL